MTGITTYKNIRNTLNVSYRFKGLPYLVADRYGNFFILEHCPNKRTIPFKMLKKSKYRAYYKGTPYSISTLKTLHISVNETISI